MPFRPISAQSRASIAGRRILVAEDDPFISMDMEDVITESGAVFVGPCGNLEDLLRAVGNARFDVAILDLRLGDSDSLPAARLLREAGVPIIFHSGDADREQIARAFPAAALCCKPCAPERLLEAAARLLEKRRPA